MKKRLVCCLLMLALAITLPFLAFAMQADDLAEVLPAGFVQEVDSFSQLTSSQLNMPIKLITRHFLGGRNIQAYASQQLDALDNGNALVLLLVIGEENYAVALGEQLKADISPEKAEALLTAHFREPFLRDRDYPRAAASFLLEIAAFRASRMGMRLDSGELLKAYAGRPAGQTPAAAFPTPGSSWLDGIFGDYDITQEEIRQNEKDVKDALRGRGGRISLFQIAVIGFILYKIFGKKKDGSKKGCGPLGWIFGAWGLSKFFGWRK